QVDDLHRGANGRADEIFGDAVAFEHAELPLGRRAAVAAHRRNEERLRSEIAQMLHGAFENQRDIRDAAAARRQSDGLAALDLAAEIQLRKRIANGCWNVVNARPRKFLTQTHHARIGHDDPRSIKQNYPALYGIE